MSEVRLVRTNAQDTDFKELIVLLDQDLAIRDGEDHAFYSQFNKVETIKEVIVAYDGDTPVACGAFKPFAADTVEIKRMFVLPNYRKQGIAAKVLAALENWAKALNFNRAVLETGNKQPEAISLYQKIGYQITPNYGQYIGVTNSVCMAKSLPTLA